VSALPAWFQQDQAQYLEQTSSIRRDGRVSLQWHPTDSVLVTVDDNYSSDSEVTNRWQFSNWFGSASAYSNVTTDSNGTITNLTYSGPQDLNAFQANTYITTNTPGLNVKWDINEHWTGTVDVAQSLSRFNPNGAFSDIDADIGYGPSTSVGTNGYTGGLVVTGANTIPFLNAVGPGSVAKPGATSPTISPNYLGLNPYILGSHDLPIQVQENTDRITQFKLNWLYHNEHTKLDFGVQYVDDGFNTSEYDTFTNNEWELWAGYGPASNNFNYYCAAPYIGANKYGTSGGNCNSAYNQTNVANAKGVPVIAVQQGVPLPASLFTQVSVPNFIPGFKGNSNLPQSLLTFSPYAVYNYLLTQPVNADAVAVAANGGPYTGGPEQLALSPGSVQDVDRKNFAPFFTGEHDFALGNMTLKADLGLRYEYTRESITGLAAALTSLSPQPGDASAYAFNLGTKEPTTATLNYGYFLPSLDLNLLVQPNLKTRFDFSRTETPTANGDIIPNTTYGGRVGALSAKGNNPGLLPYLSNNFDLGAEWYYGRNDYLSADLFFKQVSQFPTQSVQNITVPGVNDTAPGTTTIPDPNFGKPAVFAESTFTNAGSADVHGIEVTLQQMLWLGFGFQLNGTYAASNANFNPSLLQSNQFALPGVGDSANLIAFYQNYGFQARLALQWQGAQLLTLQQQQSGGQFGNEPVYLGASTTVDLTAQYDVNRYLNVFVEANNLTDAIYHTYGRFSNQTLDLVDFGRSYQFGVRVKFD